DEDLFPHACPSARSRSAAGRCQVVQAALFDVGEAHEPRAGNGHGKSAAALLEAPLLADHLVREVPGEEEEAVAGALLQAFHGMGGNRVTASEEAVPVRPPCT